MGRAVEFSRDNVRVNRNSDVNELRKYALDDVAHETVTLQPSGVYGTDPLQVEQQVLD